MRFIYDEHGDKHFGNPGGGGRGTCWKHSKEEVMDAVEVYLLSKHSELEILKATQSQDMHSVSFYIVDDMSALGLGDHVHEDKREFTIQGKYTTSEFSGGTINFHMYPDDTGVATFGIGVDKNEAVRYARSH